MKTTFIYALKELKPGEFFSTKIRYIGKSNDPYDRFQKHCITKEKNRRGNWIRSLPERGLEPQLEIIDEVPASEWEFWEREYIRAFRAIGFNLVNGTVGGAGLDNPTEETLAKIGAANRGKTRSEETRARMREAQSNRSEETRRRMSAGQLGKRWTNEMRAATSISRQNRKQNKGCSGFVGVTWNTRSNSWLARFCLKNGKRKQVGFFPYIEDAVFARALAMDKHFS